VKITPVASIRRHRTTKAERFGQRTVCFFLLMLSFIMIYPLWHVFMYSISNPIQAMDGGAFLIPRGFSVYNYKMIFRTHQIWISIRVTVLKTIFGTFLSVFLSLTTAYPLSLPRLRGRRFFQGLIFFTMLFSGGIIPTYLLVKDLGLLDTFWALIFPGAINAYNMFILRNALQAIPASLEESARIDGANPLRTCFQVIAPIATPSLAAIGLFYGLGNWNSYMDGLLYTSSSSLQLLQLYLRTVLTQTSSVNSIMSAAGEVTSDYLSQSSMQMAIVVITVLPILVVYPWLSRFYVKGLSVGAVKG
jgi:putative aldouronate transport system permease protein